MTTGKVIVVDLETTVNSQHPWGKSYPFDLDNRIVLAGSLDFDPLKEPTAEDVQILHNKLKLRNSIELNPRANWFLDGALLVGHNIKFDLHYLRIMCGNEAYYRWIREGGRIWDTMHAEYLLNNQNNQNLGLDFVAPKYNGTRKDNRIKDMWDAGVKTECIPNELLEPYLRNDVVNTAKVFAAQLNLCAARGNSFMNLVLTQMDAILATQEMEYNGVFVDNESLGKYTTTMKARLKLDHHLVVKKLLVLAGSPSIPPEAEAEINPTKLKLLEAALNGGTYELKYKVNKVDADGNVVKWKSGPKAGESRKDTVSCVLDFKCGTTIIPRYIRGGTIRTDDISLKKLMHDTSLMVRTTNTPILETDISILANRIIGWRKTQKEMSTSIPSLTKYQSSEGCIHTSYNHSVTGTGRLSSSKPNNQNLSNKELEDEHT